MRNCFRLMDEPSGRTALQYSIPTKEHLRNSQDTRYHQKITRHLFKAAKLHKRELGVLRFRSTKL
jgi:hypothetical protein